MTTATVSTLDRARRRTELVLLVLAVIVIGAAYVLASFGRAKALPNGSGDADSFRTALPVDIGPFLVVMVLLFLGAHVANRRLAPASDAMLLPVVVMLNGIGYVFIARLDRDLAGLQATWTAVGMGAYVATLTVVRRVRTLERLRYTAGFVGVGLLLTPLIPVIGREVNGARIWMRIGPVTVQPGELAKLALAVFFAAFLVERREMLGTATFKVGRLMTPDPKSFFPLVIAWGTAMVVIIFQRDLGLALLLFILFTVILWVATERATYLVSATTLFAVGAYGAFLAFSHVQRRVQVWLDPWKDPLGAGYQILQGGYAMASGGATGVGPGLGYPNLIPYASTDFIFAVIGEELGLAGTTTILAAFLLIVGTGLRVASASTDPFAKLLATGLTTLLGFQAFLIIGGVTRLIPLTGVTLPFVSYGGSSLVANYVLIALLVRLSDETNRRDETHRRDESNRRHEEAA